MTGLGGNATNLTLKELKIDGGLKEGDRLVQLKMTSPANWNALDENGGLSAMKGDVRIEDSALPRGSCESPFIGSMQADLITDRKSVVQGKSVSLREDLRGFTQMMSFELRISDWSSVVCSSELGGNATNLTLKEPKIDGGLKGGDRLVQLKMTSPANWNALDDKGVLSAMKGDVRIEDSALPGGSFEFPFIGSMQADLIKDELIRDRKSVV